MNIGFWLACPALVAWIGLLAAPWLPWSTRERIEPGPAEHDDPDIDRLTVLIPARDEADVIGRTLAGLAAQGTRGGPRVVLIDDQSTDATAAIAARFPGVSVHAGRPLPAGWSGKLWALEQGREKVTTPLTLLLDADIALEAGQLSSLLAHRRRTNSSFVSLMADLRRTSFWDRLLLPAFVYYFKLLYPFALSNSSFKYVAAAAGGCVLVETTALSESGAFTSLRGALIDDCELARQVKASGFRIWTGMSRGVVSLRPYGRLQAIHEMVARSAFTQLRYSTALLLVLTAVFAAVYWLPLLALGVRGGTLAACVALGAMVLGYAPTLRYYGMSPLWALLLPLTATFYLAMTWGSALDYWRGVRSRWKNRTYGVDSPAQ